MKIRTCFVANSSTTSFVLYGVNIEDGTLGDFDEEKDWWSVARKVNLSFHAASQEGWGYFIGVESDGSFLDKQINDKARESIRTKVNKFLDDLGYKGPRDFGVFAKTYSS
jgi:hypothetical protein